MVGTAQSLEMNNLQAWKEHGSEKAAALLIALMLEQAKDEKNDDAEKSDVKQQSIILKGNMSKELCVCGDQMCCDWDQQCADRMAQQVLTNPNALVLLPAIKAQVTQNAE